MSTEQSDRELLQWAAKALGGQVRFDLSPGGTPWLLVMIDGRMQPYQPRWNPLKDDGDALRLLVQLKIDLLHTNIHNPQVHALADLNVQKVENSSSDPNAATRRAIVMAAAEIGRNMP